MSAITQKYQRDTASVSSSKYLEYLHACNSLVIALITMINPSQRNALHLPRPINALENLSAINWAPNTSFEYRTQIKRCTSNQKPIWHPTCHVNSAPLSGLIGVQVTGNRFLIFPQHRFNRRDSAADAAKRTAAGFGVSHLLYTPPLPTPLSCLFIPLNCFEFV